MGVLARFYLGLLNKDPPPCFLRAVCSAPILLATKTRSFTGIAPQSLPGRGGAYDRQVYSFRLAKRPPGLLGEGVAEGGPSVLRLEESSEKHRKELTGLGGRD